LCHFAINKTSYFVLRLAFVDFDGSIIKKRRILIAIGNYTTSVFTNLAADISEVFYMTHVCISNRAPLSKQY